MTIFNGKSSPFLSLCSKEPVSEFLHKVEEHARKKITVKGKHCRKYNTSHAPVSINYSPAAGVVEQQRFRESGKRTREEAEALLALHLTSLGNK